MTIDTYTVTPYLFAYQGSFTHRNKQKGVETFMTFDTNKATLRNWCQSSELSSGFWRCFEFILANTDISLLQQRKFSYLNMLLKHSSVIKIQRCLNICEMFVHL